MTRNRVFLCDQSLKGYSGHCYEYFRPVREVMSGRGHEVHLVGHKAMERSFRDETHAMAAFTYWCDDRNVGQPAGLTVDQEADAIRASHESVIEADLHALDEVFDFRRDDVLVINTIRHWAIRGVVRWMEKLGHAKCPRVSLILHFTSQPEPCLYDPAIRQYREAFAAIARARCRGRIHLSTDAETLRDEYAAMTTLPISIAPFPHTLRKHVGATEAHGKGTGVNGRIKVAYAGEARRHKGFHLLPFLAQRILESDMGELVEFHFHSFIFDQSQEFYREAVAVLESLPNVRLYPQAMTSEEYEHFIQSQDVFVIPYALSNYYRQTSGIYAEAVAFGAPVVVSRGTWMAKELARIGGGVTCIADDYISLFEGTYEVCRDFAKYRRDAVAAGGRWRAAHTPQNLVKMVLDWADTAS